MNARSPRDLLLAQSFVQILAPSSARLHVGELKCQKGLAVELRDFSRAVPRVILIDFLAEALEAVAWKSRKGECA